MKRILIVEARFYDDLADALLAGATTALKAEGVEFDKITVPGALEIPGAIAMASASGHAAGCLRACSSTSRSASRSPTAK